MSIRIRSRFQFRPGGLRNIWEMDAFCCQRGFQFATRGIGKPRGIEERDAVRYCFRVADDAEEFQAMYGGERVALPVKKPAAQSFGGRGLWTRRRA